MTISFEDRLIAIQNMLDSSSQEIVLEGFDSIFNLWLKHSDSQELTIKLSLIAKKHPSIIQELNNRINTLPTVDSNTDAYLRKNLKALIVELEKINQETPNDAEGFEPSLVKIIATDTPKPWITWWQSLIIMIIVTAGLLLVFLPNLYQKLLISIIAVILSITLPYIFPKKDFTILINTAFLKLNYSFPTYLSVGDENTVHVSIENSGKAEFEGKITLVFDDPSLFVTPAPDHNLSVNVDVIPNGRETKQFKFLVLNRTLDKNLNYYFHISSNNGAQYKSNEENFLIAPIPYLRSTWAWLLGAIGILVAVLLEQLFGF